MRNFDVTITDEAIEESSKLSVKYMTDKNFQIRRLT